LGERHTQIIRSVLAGRLGGCRRRTRCCGDPHGAPGRRTSLLTVRRLGFRVGAPAAIVASGGQSADRGPGEARCVLGRLSRPGTSGPVYPAGSCGRRNPAPVWWRGLSCAVR